MTHTKTFAEIDESAAERMRSLGELQLCKRKPTTTTGFFIVHGDYRVHTGSGPITAAGPTWILFDLKGDPYPITVDEFNELYDIV